MINDNRDEVATNSLVSCLTVSVADLLPGLTCCLATCYFIERTARSFIRRRYPQLQAVPTRTQRSSWATAWSRSQVFRMALLATVFLRHSERSIFVLI